MAIAFDAAASSSGTGTSLTYNHTCTGSNRILWVSIGVNSADSVDHVTGVTYNSVAMTRGPSMFSGVASLDGQYLYYLVAPATGTNSVVVSTNNSQPIYATSVSYTGAKQSGQPDNTASSNGSGASTITLNITPSANGCWVITGASDEQVGNPAINGGITARGSNQVEGNAADSNATVTAGSPFACNWKTPNGNNGLFSVVAASFAPAVSVSNLALLGAG